MLPSGTQFDSLDQKDTPFKWSPVYQKSSKKLKKCFISAVVLCYFDSRSKMIVETDISTLIIAGVLFQYENECLVHRMTYFSRKHLPTEINYENYDKELVTVIRTFKE
jgi:hypothetical protein